MSSNTKQSSAEVGAEAARLSTVVAENGNGGVAWSVGELSTGSPPDSSPSSSLTSWI